MSKHPYPSEPLDNINIAKQDSVPSEGEDYAAKLDPYGDTFIEHILFEEDNPLNLDPDYWFRLRGSNEDNLFIDCATPLIGLILRAKKQKKPHQDLNRLYQQCVDEITSIEYELLESGQETATVIAYRYILCTFIDEAIMSTEWGASSSWMSKSLLVHFHNESWGGEKIYLIIKKLEQDFEKYFNLLEFVFICLCLGFQGRFKVLAYHEQKKHEAIVHGLYDKLRLHRKQQKGQIVSPYDNIVPKKYAFDRMMTPKKVILSVLCITFIIYLVYAISLSSSSSTLVTNLRDVLSQEEQL